MATSQPRPVPVVVKARVSLSDITRRGNNNRSKGSAASRRRGSECDTIPANSAQAATTNNSAANGNSRPQMPVQSSASATTTTSFRVFQDVSNPKQQFSAVKVPGPISAESQRVVETLNDLKRVMFHMKSKNNGNSATTNSTEQRYKRPKDPCPANIALPPPSLPTTTGAALPKPSSLRSAECATPVKHLKSKNTHPVPTTAISLLDTPEIAPAARGRTNDEPALHSPIPSYQYRNPTTAMGNPTSTNISSNVGTGISAVPETKTTHNFLAPETAAAALEKGLVTDTNFSALARQFQHKIAQLKKGVQVDHVDRNHTAFQSHSRDSTAIQTNRLASIQLPEEVTMLRQKRAEATKTNQYLRAAILHAQIVKLEEAAGLPPQPQQVTNHSSTAAAVFPNAHRSPQLQLLGVKSPTLSPFLPSNTQDGACESMSSPAELSSVCDGVSGSILFDDEHYDSSAGGSFPQPLNFGTVVNNVDGGDDDRAAGCGAGSPVGDQRYLQTGSKVGQFSVDRFLADDSASCEDRIKALSSRLHQLKQERTKASGQGATLFGFSKIANILNQPLTDQAEKTRLAERMVTAYVAGNIPPPPGFQSPAAGASV